MKILYLTQSYPPMISGAALVVARLAEGMAASGDHQCLVIAASDEGHTYIEHHENLTILRLRSLTNPQRAYQHFIPWGHRSILNEIRSFQPDLIHIHDPLVLGIAGIRAARRGQIPALMTLHQLPWFISAYLPQAPWAQRLIESSLWRYSRWLNHCCQGMVFPTETIACAVAKHGGFRPAVISNGVDLRHFSPGPLPALRRQELCRKYELDPQLPVILHVGRLDRDKGVRVIVQAASKAIKCRPAQLLVLGDGTERQALTELAHWSGIAGFAHFPGFVVPQGSAGSQGDLADLYRLADLFVMASEIETQGLVLLEALACGLPVVAVRATCVPEIIRDGVNGYLVAPREVDHMAQRIVDLLDAPQHAQRMGAAGRQIAEQHAVSNCIHQYTRLYQRMLQIQAGSESIPATRRWQTGSQNH